jgi:hypothetical protein
MRLLLDSPDDDRVLELGVLVVDREKIVGTRLVEDRVAGGRVTVVELRVLDRLGSLGLDIDGRLPVTIRLRVEPTLDRVENDDRGADRLTLGAELRAGARVGVRVEKLRDGALARGLTDRRGDGARREIELLLREGVDGRGLDDAIERLGVGRAACRLGETDRRTAERPRDEPPSAASDSNRTAAMVIATMALLEPSVFFTRNITYLLSPADILSHSPGLPFPHCRRQLTRHARSRDSGTSSYTQGAQKRHKSIRKKILRREAPTAGQPADRAVSEWIPSQT